jgi:Arc/MetJ-type ribon-helix-helix transcriptional regulator
MEGGIGMTIDLPEEVERSIHAAVKSGRFACADDAVATAWRLFERVSPSMATHAKSPLAMSELNARLLASGMITELPDPAQDIEDDEDDDPVVIAGELLSETIIRERR